MEPPFNVAAVEMIGIEVCFWICAPSGLIHSFVRNPRAALRSALGLHVSALQALQASQTAHALWHENGESVSALRPSDLQASPIPTGLRDRQH